jgi:Ca-activated chloride channel family protein
MRRMAAVVAALFAAVAQGAAPPVAVRITSPVDSQPVYDVITVSAVVAAAEPVAVVTFEVDGRVFAEVRTPPYEATTDLGPDNIEHRFVVKATTTGGASAEAKVTTPKIESDMEVRVELQQVYAVVRQHGERVTTLKRGDFKVSDDGREQEIVTFARGDIPFAAAVLIDASSSMAGPPLAAALAGARSFLGGMNPLDEGKLVVFSDHVVHATPFAGVAEVLIAGLGSVSASGGTALNDVLFSALEALEERQGRRVVVLLSDGVDVHSALPMSCVAEKAREGQALIYWIRRSDLGGEGAKVINPTTAAFNSPWHGSEQHHEEFRRLERAVKDSGGEIIDVRQLEEVPAAFAGVLADLREQYVIGYYPSRRRHDGSWHKLKVSVSLSGADVTTRAGYVDH